MFRENRLQTALLLLVASLAGPRAAAGQDTDAMAKWTEVKVVQTPTEGELQIQLQLPPGMMLAMPAESRGYDVSKDGKSLLTKPENGWSWVITPSIVR